MSNLVIIVIVTGLFRFLLGLFNDPGRTRDWVERPARRLKFDFDSASLCGTCIGSTFEQLSWLGRAEYMRKFDSRRGIYVWYTKGLQIDVDGDLFTSITFSFDPAGTDRFQPFSGTFGRNGREFRVEPASSVNAIQTLMGEPAARQMFDDMVDVVEFLTYRIGEHEYVFDFDDEGNLCSLTAGI